MCCSRSEGRYMRRDGEDVVGEDLSREGELNLEGRKMLDGWALERFG